MHTYNKYGILAFGNYDPLCIAEDDRDNLRVVKTIDNQNWTVNATNFKFGRHQVDIPSRKVLLDPSAAFIYLPYSDFELLKAAIIKVFDTRIECHSTFCEFNEKCSNLGSGLHFKFDFFDS